MSRTDNESTKIRPTYILFVLYKYNGAADAASLKTSLFPFHANQRNVTQPCEKYGCSYSEIYRGYSIENVAYNKAVRTVLVSSIIFSHFIRHSEQDVVRKPSDEHE